MKIYRVLTVQRWIKQTTAAALWGVAAMGSAHACGDDDYIGSVCVVGFNWCPENTLPMDGSLLPPQQYQLLYSLIGTTYGGTAPTTFALPDMRGRMPVGLGLGPGLTAVVQGQKDGVQGVTLTAANLPNVAANLAGTASGTINVPLTNTAISGQSIIGDVSVKALNGDTAPSGGANIPSPTQNTVGKAGVSSNFYPPSTTNAVAVPASHNLAVSGGAVTGTAAGNVSLPVTGTVTIPGSNVQVATISPRQAVNFCIVVNGIYPQRP